MRLFQECASEMVPYIAICAFAGLRPTEAAKLDWKDINLETAQIEVKARHAKTRRHRLVPIQPNLLAWLTIYRKEAGRIGFSRRKFREAYARGRLCRVAAGRSAALVWHLSPAHFKIGGRTVAGDGQFTGCHLPGTTDGQ